MSLSELASKVALDVAKTHAEPSVRDVVNKVMTLVEKHDLNEEAVTEVVIQALDVALPDLPFLPHFLSEIVEDSALDVVVPALVHEAFRLLR